MEGTNLRVIPGVGPDMKKHLIRLGYHVVEDLKGADPDAMYQKDVAFHGGKLDRCVLYVYRCCVDFASCNRDDPYTKQWWNFKDN